MKTELFAQVETLDYEVQKLGVLLDKFGVTEQITTAKVKAALDTIWEQLETELEED